MLQLLTNPNKFSHHKKLIVKLIKANLLMHDLQVSDKGGCIVRDSEEYMKDMNRTLKNIIKGR